MKNRAGWEQGAIKGLKRFRYVAVPTLLWLAVSLFQLASANFIHSSRMVLSVLLFLLGIPTSIIFRLDNFSTTWGMEEYHHLVIVVALLMVLLNFVAIGAVSGFLKGSASAPPPPAARTDAAGLPQPEHKKKRDSQR